MAYRWVTKLVTQRQLWPTFPGRKFFPRLLYRRLLSERDELGVLCLYIKPIPEIGRVCRAHLLPETGNGFPVLVSRYLKLAPETGIHNLYEGRSKSS